MIADSATLLTALNAELTDRIIPVAWPCPLGPGQRPEVPDAELVCLAVAQVLDATLIPCGQSAVTTRRSGLYGWAGYGYCPCHSRRYCTKPTCISPTIALMSTLFANQYVMAS